MRFVRYPLLIQNPNFSNQERLGVLSPFSEYRPNSSGTGDHHQMARRQRSEANPLSAEIMETEM
jgi:hypothetical protein